MDKIELIQLSLRCFTSGLFALLPWVGIFPAGYTFWLAHRVRSQVRGDWNPASRYVTGGVWCACGGLVLTLLITVCLTAAAIGHIDASGPGCVEME